MMKDDTGLLHLLVSDRSELRFFQAFLKILTYQLTTLNVAKKSLRIA